MMMQQNRTVMLAVLMLVATVLAGCHEPGAAGDNDTDGDGNGTGSPSPSPGSGAIRIGLLMPLTGDVAGLGVPAANGVRLAVAEINAAGGIDGRNLELVEGDTRFLTSEAVSEFQRIVGQDVHFVVGALGSDLSAATKPHANDAEVVLMSPASTRPSLTGADHGYFFRVIANDTVQGPQAAALLYEDLAEDSAVVMYHQTGYAEGLKDEFVPAFEGLGGTVNGAPIAYSDEITTYDARAADAVNRNPAYIWIAGQSPHIAHLIASLRGQGYTGGILTSEAIEDPEIFEVACDDVNGALFTKAAPEQGPRLTAFQANYTARFNEDPGPYSSFGYDATFVGAAAITATGNDGPAIKAWLEANPVGGRVTTETIRFNANGDITTGGYTLWEITCVAGQGGFTPHVV